MIHQESSLAICGSDHMALVFVYGSYIEIVFWNSCVVKKTFFVPNLSLTEIV